MRSRSVLLLPALLAVLIFQLPAQGNSNNASKDEPVLKTTTRAVVVDVVITGNSGTSVLGLDQRDFFILEDGKPQAINFFEEHSAQTAQP